jgi:hypothetical protein
MQRSMKDFMLGVFFTLAMIMLGSKIGDVIEKPPFDIHLNVPQPPEISP